MTEPTRREATGSQVVPMDQLPPRPAAEVIDGEDTPVAIDFERLVYPGEVLHGGVTLAVLLPGDEKESFVYGKHTAIAQPHEDYADIKDRIITTTTDIVVTEVEVLIDRFTEMVEGAADDSNNQTP
jgi:hypothetical protein